MGNVNVPASDDLIERLHSRFMFATEPELIARLEQLQAEVERLRLFSGRILNASREHMTDVDGGDVEAFALETGLMEPFRATESCGDWCGCAGNFPATCYRYTDAGRAAIAATQAQKEQQ